jgi:hypothetical protein
MGIFKDLYESAGGSVPQKRTFVVHVTPKGKSEPETYEHEAYSPRSTVRHHQAEGNTLHKIVDKHTGEDVTNE